MYLGLYGNLFFIVVIINLIPAFAPPTWALLTDAVLKWRADPWITLVVGLVGAALGRSIMYVYSTFFYKYVPAKKKARMEEIKQLIEKKKKGFAELVFVYSLGPLPSNFLFILGGLMELPFIPLLVGFVLGRAVSYGLAMYIFGEVVKGLEGSGYLILPYLDAAVLILTILLIFVDWEDLFHKHIKNTLEGSPKKAKKD